MLGPITADGRDDILKLNNEHSIELSWLDSQRLDQILRWAYHARMVLDGSAFLIAFAAGSGYDGANFLWFKSRYEQFIYIDRVAVALQQRGRGIARSLYADLFDRAIADGYSVVTCEVNISPPNLASLTFHADLGFREVGEARTPTGKVVKYLARQLSVGAKNAERMDPEESRSRSELDNGTCSHISEEARLRGD